MSDERERGFRDDHGAALERAARLQEENDRLRAELDAARKAKTDPPPAPKPRPQPPAARVGLAIAIVGAVVGAAFAVGLRKRPPPPPPAPYVNVPLPTFTAPMPSFAFDGIVMPPILMEGVSAGARPKPRGAERIVEVRSRPRGASVTLDGRPVGVTPTWVRFKPDTCSDDICRATLALEGKEATIDLGADTVGVVGHDFVVSETKR